MERGLYWEEKGCPESREGVLAACVGGWGWHHGSGSGHGAQLRGACRSHPGWALVSEAVRTEGTWRLKMSPESGMAFAEMEGLEEEAAELRWLRPREGVHRH